MPQYLKPVPDWEEHEKPTLPGSASMPWHPPHRRLAYALVALLVGITGGLGNALVSANQLGTITEGSGSYTPSSHCATPSVGMKLSCQWPLNSKRSSGPCRM